MEQNIFVNEVLYCNDVEQLYRVLWISAGQEYGYWIPVDGKMNGIPVKFDCKKVAGGLTDGIITSVDDPITFRDINMTAEAMEQRDEWWRILKPVLESEPDIYERKRRGELLAEAADKNGKSKTNLYRYIIKYWKRGKTPSAFLQDYRNCGKGEKTQANKKLGRPVVHEGGFGNKMLNFFVTLVNTIGVPVVMIGTTKAMSILQGEFRQARRGSGQGDLIWDRMGNDAAWNVFVKSMWRYQWTGKNVAYTDELANVLYDESQGIIDIAVKLYAIVQIDAITNGTEEFSASDIRKAAEKKLGLVKPMLDALRSGDKKRILKYEDIAPVNIEDYLSAYKAVKTEVQKKTTEQKLTVLEQTSIKLMEVEVEPAMARRLAGKVLASHKNPISVGEAFKEAYRLYIAENTSVPVEDVLGDIRNNESYDGFRQSGAVDEMEW